MNKRGISTIIVTVILVALVLIAVGVVWAVVSNLLLESKEDISLERLTIDANINDVTTNESANNISVLVKRNPGGGNLVGFKFLFKNLTDAELHTINATMNELEERVFTFYLNMSVSEVLTVTIIPLIQSGDKLIFGTGRAYNVKSEADIPLGFETADILVIDGENAGESSPWEFDSVYKHLFNQFELSSDAANNGDKGYRITGGGVYSDAYGTYSFTEKGEVYVRLYVRLDEDLSGPAYGYANILTLMDGASSFGYLGYRANYAGIPYVWTFNRGTLSTSTTDFSLGDWHYVEMYFRAGTGLDGQCTFYVDGSMRRNITNGPYSSWAIDGILVGQGGNFVIDSGKYWDFDDIVISTTGPIGPYSTS